MPHVTMIHGIGNKRQADQLQASWEYALKDAGGLDLETNGITTSMIYWADVFYEAPSVGEAHESTGDEVLTSEVDEDLSWLAVAPEENQAFVAQLQSEMAHELDPPPGETQEYAPPEAAQDGTYERIPIPWFLKRRMMKAFLRDVHHYLFNATSTPRPGDEYEVQTEIRGRFVDQLAKDAEHNQDGPHVILSHSMGTVIAYDCLQRDERCPRVDGLMTIGSPLGIDEIQDKLKPQWSRVDGFPRSKVASDWINVYDSLDIVSRLDPKIGNDFRETGLSVIDDIEVVNQGLWRHDISQYLRREAVRDKLAAQLGL